MLINLLGFFAEGDDANAAGNTGNLFGLPSWAIYVILGVVAVGFVLLMILPQRKQKKRNEEMMAKLGIGSVVTTIGGIVGEVVDLDDKHIWILTGIGDNRTTMQFVRQAIHSIAPAPGSPEAQAEEKAAKEKEDEIDEIK